MIIHETTQLQQEKAELYRKLSRNEEPENKEAMEKRVGEIEIEVRNIIQDILKTQKVEVSKQRPEKPMTLKEAKRLLKKKYEDFRQLTLDARALVDSLVEKKKEGRALLETAVDVKDEKKFISDVLRF